MRIEAGQGQIQVNNQQALDILSRMGAGDVVRAKVLEINASDVVLKLFDGSVLKAATATNLDVKAGDLVDLLIKEKIDNKLVMETFKSGQSINVNFNAGIEMDITKFLTDNQLNSKDNQKLATNLKQNSLPLNKETFDEISNLMKGLGLKNAQEAVFAYKNGFDTNVGDTATLAKVIDGRFKIGNELKDILKELSNTLDSTNTLVSAGEENISLAKSIKTVNENALKMMLQNGITNKELPEDILNQFMKEMTASEKIEFQKNGLKDILNHHSMSKVDVENFENVLKTLVANEFSDITIHEDETQLNHANLINRDINKEKQISEKLNSIVDSFNKNGLSILEPNGQKTLINLINKFFPTIDSDKVIELIQKSINEMKLGNGSENEGFSPMNGLKEDLLKLLNNSKDKTTPEPNTLNLVKEQLDKPKNPLDDLKDTIQKLFVKIEKDMDSEQLRPSNVYENSLKSLEHIKNILKETMPEIYQNFSGKIENIESGMKFISQINQYNAYVQLPINFNNFNTSGELYFFKKEGSKKKLDPENVSMLLCLDTQNIGRVDSLVNVNKKNINIQVRIQDSSYAEIIKENVYLLHQALMEKGYKLVDLKCSNSIEPVTPANAAEISAAMQPGKQSRIDFTI